MAAFHLRSKALVLFAAAALVAGVACIELDAVEGRSCDLTVPGRGCLVGWECVNQRCVLAGAPQPTVDSGTSQIDGGTFPFDAGEPIPNIPPPFDGGSGQLPFAENFEAFPAGAWPANSQQGRWTVLDVGTATIVQDDTRAVRLDAPVTGTGNARPRSLILSPVSAGDFDATVRVKIPSGTLVPSSGVELRWRYRGPDQFLYLTVERYFPLDTVILEVGANGQSGTKQGVAESVPGGFTTVRVRHVGGQVDVSLNGVQQMSVAQPAALNGGVFGIAGYGSGATFDDVSITAP